MQSRNLSWLLKSLLIAVGLAIWIFLQPNLSNVIVILGYLECSCLDSRY